MRSFQCVLPEGRCLRRPRSRCSSPPYYRHKRLDHRREKLQIHCFAVADTPERMLIIGQEKIQDLIRTVGLFRNKAKAIFKSSQLIVEHHGSIVPGNLKDLMSLPGVGLKTASILLQFWFGIEAMPVDTHIFRCARRWGLSNSKKC